MKFIGICGTFLFFLLYSCSDNKENCVGELSYATSMDSAITKIANSNDYVLLIVKDSSEQSAKVDTFFQKNPCWKDSISFQFTSIVSFQIADKFKKKSFDRVLTDFKKEHHLSFPYALVLGMNDTVFAFTSLLPNSSSTMLLDSAWSYLLAEKRNPLIRADYTFLHGEKMAYNTPSYYSWTKEINATLSYDEKGHKLRLEISNPQRIRIVSEGTNQRDYMTPLHVLSEDDSIAVPRFTWLSVPSSFRDDFLKKSYLAYTDSIIIGEAILPESSNSTLPYNLKVSYSAYIPKRKAMINSMIVSVKNLSPKSDTLVP